LLERSTPIEFGRSTPAELRSPAEHHDEVAVEYSASKRTMTGTDYLVRCEDHQTERSREWLLRELELFRSTDRVGSD
jgi:hypothetical protein